MGLPAMQDGMCQRARLDGGSEREGDGGPTSNDRLLIRYSIVFGVTCCVNFHHKRLKIS